MLILSPTLRLVISRTLPMTVGLFSIMLVQLVDTIFIGMLGVDELAVHGVTLPFQAGLIGVQVGIGVAATAIVSQARGAGHFRKSAATASISTLFGVAFVSLICLFLWLFGEQLFSFFISEEKTGEHYTLLLSIFQRYWPLWLLSSVTVAALYLISSVYRANEDSKTTGSMFALASLINLVLDPVLIFFFEMGIAGAAIASATGYAFCALFMLYKARNRNWFAAIEADCRHKVYLTRLLKIAFPATANQILPSVSAFISMMLIASLGTDSIAFWSLLTRLESFLLVFTLALTMAVPPIVGCYIGAREPEKIGETIKVTVKFLLLFHFCVALIVLFGSSALIPLLSSEAIMQGLLEESLWILPFSYGPLGLCMLVVSVFNVMGLAKKALRTSVIRLFVLYIPAIWFGVSSESLLITVVSATAANIMSGFVAWSMLSRHIKDKIETGHSLLIN